MLTTLAAAALLMGPLSPVRPQPGLAQETVASDSSSERPAWHRWRGPLGTGFAPGAAPPLRWSETENLRWRTALPGPGHGTPVVAGGVAFLTATHGVGETIPPRPDTAPGAHDNVRVNQRQRYLALAVDLEDGSILWQTALAEGFPHEGGHATGTYASASPVTDGERLFVSFGSAGVFGLDVGGQVLWERQLGPLATKHGHGEGSSPALYTSDLYPAEDGEAAAPDTLFVIADHEGESYLVALDALTGEDLWRVARDEVTSWSSPLVALVDGRPQVIVNGTGYVRGHDVASGAELWRCTGLSHNVVATPVLHDGLLFATSSYEKQALLALRLSGARGDLAGTEHLAWYRRRNTPYVPSPLAMDGALYVLSHYQGLLSRYDAKSGERAHRPLRLAGIDDVYASLLGTETRVYIVDRSGWTAVLSHADPPVELARNRLDDRFSASPVAVGRDLLLRGERFLYCLREDEHP